MVQNMSFRACGPSRSTSIPIPASCLAPNTLPQEPPRSNRGRGKGGHPKGQWEQARGWHRWERGISQTTSCSQGPGGRPVFTRESRKAQAQEVPCTSKGRGQGTPTLDRLRVYTWGGWAVTPTRLPHADTQPDPKDRAVGGMPAGSRCTAGPGTGGPHKTRLPCTRFPICFLWNARAKRTASQERQTRTREVRGR